MSAENTTTSAGLCGVQVPRLDSLRASGPLALARMIKKCGPQIFACVNDPDCKAALDCLQSCSPTDQVGVSPSRLLHNGLHPAVLLAL